MKFRPCLILIILLAYVAGAVILPAAHGHSHGETCHQHAVPPGTADHSHSHAGCSHSHQAPEPARPTEQPANIPHSDDDCPLCELWNTPAQPASVTQVPEIAQRVCYLPSGNAISAAQADGEVPQSRGPPQVA